MSSKKSYKSSRDGGWRSNFGGFFNSQGLTTAGSCLSSVQFPSTCTAAAVSQTPIVAGSDSAGTAGSGASPAAGTGM
jgi:hypothetical protein